MAKNPAGQKEVTTREVASIRFGMYADEEVRKLSVKRITAPMTYDSFGQIIPNGLYDSAMGPADINSRCSTCGLGHAACPGHFGHIDLPVPVYNPLVFGTLYRLLKHTCLNCHHFKMGRKEMSKFLVKFSCLTRGDLVAASLIHTSGAGPRASALEQLMGLRASSSSSKKAGGSSKTPESQGTQGLGFDGDLGTGLGAYEATYGEKGPQRVQQLPQTCHIQDALRTAVSEFFTRMPTVKCQNCGCTNPSIRKQGSTRVFKQYTRKALIQNSMRGINAANLVGSGSKVAADEVTKLMRQAEAAAAAAGKKRKRDAGAAADQQQQQEEEEQAKKKGGVQQQDLKGIKQQQQQQQVESEDEYLEEDEDDEQQQQPAAKAAGGVKGAKSAAENAAAAQLNKQFSIDAKTKPLYMDPEEVEGHVSQLCRNESGILRHLYGSTDLSTHAGVGSMQRRGHESVRRAARTEPARLYKSFFIRALAVPPNRFRPPSVMGDSKFEHTQNVTMQRILNACLNLTSIEEDMRKQREMQDTEAAAAALTEAQQQQIQRQRNLDMLQRFTSGWLRLQNEVNALIDSTSAENTDQNGVRQQLEKKEGLFRKNMMGKRVNYAARSVISPDPYIGAGEIGVPPYFATRLSFPEAVTGHNVLQLMEMVKNGAEVHPGALAVEDAAGRVIVLAKLDRKRREGIAKQLQNPYFQPQGKGGRASGADAAGTKRGKIVHRHLVDGDLMLTNRQPTLHKPGLMAHRARVLKGERTIRMHYANCSTFNADFDGDEINLHLPQDHLGRAEGYNIVHADRQFIVPTDGKPIRGLIQDHVGAGVIITCRDTFFTKAEFGQLLFNACTPWRPGGTPSIQIHIPPPALLKPRQLWTGKQLLSSVVSHFSRGRPPITFHTGSKVPLSYWGNTSDEGEFLFYKGQLMTGCLDKAQFGKFGLVHAMQELYGDEVAGAMLNALSRLLTAFLQGHGFTCGMDDLLLRPQAEAARTRILAKAEPTALAASAEVVKSKLVTASAIAKSQVKHRELAHPDDAALLAQNSKGKLSGLLAAERYMVAKQLEQHYCTNGTATGAVHDAKVTGVMHPLASEVIKACIPAGQAKPFPANCMSLMTVSGAKGSTVNFSQISCLLGQQELEGRRVPRTASGKTLPCFRAYDGGARAGGFVGDRFLTGLRPQEYYFHCMAGREGLVDTTVKTSRSGYLQRCLVKNLEALRVAYDGTVRDVCDNSVVQLYYGDDGLDVTKVSYMKQTAFLAVNATSAARQLGLTQGSVAGDEAGLTSQGLSPYTAVEQQDAAAAVRSSSSRKHKQLQLQLLLQGRLREFGLLGPRQAEVAAAMHIRSDLIAAAAAGDKGAQQQLKTDLPLMARWCPSVLGVTSESFADALQRFCTNPSQHLLITPEIATAAADAAAAANALAAAAAAADGSSRKEVKKAAKRRQELLTNLVTKQVLSSESKLAQMAVEDFRSLMQLKFMSALAAPGEAVGVIAAQSVGEPSTQMTLNTFHMAGRGEANVTLGIPRLREILMTAAPRIKTPTMTMPLQPTVTEADAQLLASRMKRLKLAECLRGLKAWERPAIPTPHMVTGSKWGKGYDLHLRFHELSLYPKDAELTWQKLEDACLKLFVPQLKAALKKQLKKQGLTIGSVAVAAVEAPRAGGDDDEEYAGEGGEGGGSSRGRAKAARDHEDQQNADDDDQPEEAAEDEDADEELREGKLRFRGGRGEAATYEGPDDEDEEAEAAINAEMRQRLGENDDEDGGNVDSDKQQQQDQQPKQADDQASESADDDEENDERNNKSRTKTADRAKLLSAAAAVAKRLGRSGRPAPEVSTSAAAAAGGSSERKRRTAKTAGDDLIKATVAEINGRMQCEIQVVLPMTAPKVLMLELAEEVATTVLVHHVPGIQAVHLLDPEKAGEPRRLQTEGINFQGVWEQQKLIDVDKIACNDVHAMLTTYGVEAARATILKEVQAVFGAYGIGVDPRHLGLIADFMTHQGGYKACNRIGIDSETSPLLKMSFETAAKFLMDAALTGGGDKLTSPAARIVVGQVTEVGTGCCKVLHALE